MQKNHMHDVVASLIGLADLYGKPQPTPAAQIHWWETLKEFDYTDVMSCLGYWAKESTSMPTPKAVWDKLNSRRTEAIEEKAAFERSSNRGMVAHDFRPNEVGRRALKACIAMLKDKPKPEGRHGWARKIVAMHARGENVPYLTLQIARQRLDEIDPNRIDL
jgi:hypothetical protein